MGLSWMRSIFLRRPAPCCSWVRLTSLHRNPKIDRPGLSVLVQYLLKKLHKSYRYKFWLNHHKHEDHPYKLPGQHSSSFVLDGFMNVSAVKCRYQ